MEITAAVLGFMFCAGIGEPRQAPSPPAEAETVASLQAKIEALKAAAPAWREIPWKSCLLDGLNESRASGKPVLLWIFIDRPIDDARC